MPNQERRDENPLDRKRKTRDLDDPSRTVGQAVPKEQPSPKQKPQRGPAERERESTPRKKPS
jgi:hypothetical protein